MTIIRKSFKRIISTFAIVVILASGMSNSVYAAVDGTTAKMVANDAQILRESKENEAKIERAYEAIKKAFNTNSVVDMAYARKLVEALSPTNRIRLFVRMSKSYYYANYLDFTNKYFNAHAYIKAYPDIAAKAGASRDPLLYALEHYLDIGIYEGRSSQTGFDPVIAILIDPDCVLAVMETGELTPDIISREFTKHTGYTTTEGYTVLWKAPLDDEGVYSCVPLSHTLYISKLEPGKGTSNESQTLEQFLENDDIEVLLSQQDLIPSIEDFQKYLSERLTAEEEKPSKPGRDNPSRPTPTPIPTPEPTCTTYVNQKALDIQPYQLYFDTSSEDKQTGTISGVGPDGTNATVTYYGQTYLDIVNNKLSEPKDYTFMIYMCGSDQETNDKYVRVSKQLLSMVKAGDLSNINVLVCVGGSPDFQNDYMKGTYSDEDCIRNDGVGIYYLDGSEFTSAYNNLSVTGKSVLDLDFVEMTYKNINELKEGFGVINQDTFKKIATISSIDMGDAGVLAGFIDLATELFPASNYGLSLSNHGGGLEGGVCLSADSSGIGGTTIMAEELESVLKSTSLYKNNKKFGTLFYDACLMSSAEIAFSLKDCYEYMLASEEVTLGETNYETLLKTISDISRLSGDADLNKKITQQMLQAYSETKYHKGQAYYLEASTMSVFSSEQIDQTIEGLEDAASLMKMALNDSEFVQNGIDKKLLEATRKALLACSDYNNASALRKREYRNVVAVRNVVDLGEFVGYLIKNIDQIMDGPSISGDANIKNRLIEIKKKLLEVSLYGKAIDGNSYIWKGVPIIDDGDVTEEYKRLRGEDVNTSGISVVIPGSDKLGKQYASYFDYEGSPLKEYYDFIGQYYEYINNSSREEKIASLTNELKEADYTRLLMPVKNGVSTVQSLSEASDPDSSYISFKVADSYEEVNVPVPEHSFGSPMQDILETAYSIDISVVHQEKYDIKGSDAESSTGTLRVDMLCGEAVIDPNSVSFDNGTVNFSVNNLSTVVTGYKLSGTAISGAEDEEHGDAWQYVLASEYEKDPKKKVEILAQLSITNENYVPYFLVINGTANTGTEIIENVQHVFLGDFSDYTYYGTVVTVGDAASEGSLGFNKVENITQLSAYHYVLVNEGDTDSPKYVRKCLEIDYKDYGISSGYYNVAKDVEPTIKVVRITQTVEDVETIANNGYVLSVRNEAIDIASSYSDIAKIDASKYDSAADSGNGLLVVEDNGNLAESGLDVLKNTNHHNDTDDGMSPVDEESNENNLTSKGKNTTMDSVDEQQEVIVLEMVTDDSAEQYEGVPTEETTISEIEVQAELVDDETLSEEDVISQLNPYVYGGVDVSEYTSQLVGEEVVYNGDVRDDNVADQSDSDDNSKASSQTEEMVLDDEHIIEISTPSESGDAA